MTSDPSGLDWVFTGLRIRIGPTRAVRGSWIPRAWINAHGLTPGHFREAHWRTTPNGTRGIFDFEAPPHPRAKEGYRYVLDPFVQNLQFMGWWDNPPFRWAWEQRWEDNNNNREEVRVTVLVQEMNRNPRPDPYCEVIIDRRDLRTGVVIVGTSVGIGYVIYRGVRMIPSIVFPPLWWTVPGNAVLP